MNRLVLLIFLSLSISLAFSQEKDTPLQGEGIYAFLRRHNMTEAAHYQEFIKLNKNKLGKSTSLVMGTVYLLPPIKVTGQSNQSAASGQKKTGTNPLFGEKYKNYEIIDNKLTGACFYLVSGHAGPDPGAVAKVKGNELWEDEYAYDIMLRLARNLLQHGATVHIIIQDSKDGIRDGMYLNNNKSETCMGKKIPSSHIARLKQQSDAINNLNFRAKEKYQRAIFIHLDSGSKKTKIDVFFYYQKGSKNIAKSKQLAETMQKTFRDSYKRVQPKRGFSGTVSARNLYVMKNTNPVSIYAELANMQNSSDQERFLKESNRQILANWLCDGFIKDFQSASR